VTVGRVCIKSGRKVNQPSLIAEPYFLQFGVPLITVGLSIFLRYVTRNDHYSGFVKEDLAVGLDLAVTALLLFIAASAQVAQSLPTITDTGKAAEMATQLSSVPWLLMSFVVGIWAVSTIVRKLGWESDGKLNVGWGIVVPDIFGLVALIFVVNWIM
jgi:uncharacterized membrane protein YgcG